MTRTPSYEEVIDILRNNTFYSNDLPGWVLEKKAPYTQVLSFGLLDKSFFRTKYKVDLQVQFSLLTHRTNYRFTLFLSDSIGDIRLYQLEIKKYKNTKKIVKHNMPHDHIGNKRLDGELEWYNWQFEEALDKFLSRVNINFNEKPRDPEIFILEAPK